MTTVECWHYCEQPDPNIEQDLNLPFSQHYQDVATGSILKNVNEIKLGEQITFYVFRVTVGRSLVMCKRDLKDGDDHISMKRGKYHSIYLSEEGPNELPS